MRRIIHFDQILIVHKFKQIINWFFLIGVALVLFATFAPSMKLNDRCDI